MLRSFILGAAGALISTVCFAHITLEVRQAPAGSTYRAVLRVPHGCQGSPTIAVRIRIPDGVFNVKPMPKPGWTIETKKGKYAKSYGAGHGELSEGVLELSWTGGRLPDDHYDEFVFRAALSADLPPNKPIYFPVVAECEKGVERWIETPIEGQKLDDLEFPAAELMISPKR